MASAWPQTPAVEAALKRLHDLGAELEAEGMGRMQSARETTTDGYALWWLGLWMQKQVDDDLIPYDEDPEALP